MDPSISDPQQYFKYLSCLESLWLPLLPFLSETNHKKFSACKGLCDYIRPTWIIFISKGQLSHITYYNHRYLIILGSGTWEGRECIFRFLPTMSNKKTLVYMCVLMYTLYFSLVTIHRFADLWVYKSVQIWELAIVRIFPNISCDKKVMILEIEQTLPLLIFQTLV